MKYTVAELGIGEILNQAIAVLKNRFGLLLGITSMLLVPFHIVSGLAVQAIMPIWPAQPTAADVVEYQYQYVRALPALIGIMALYFVVVSPLTNAAITFAVANEYLERPVTIGSVLRRTARIALPFLGTGFLYSLTAPGIVFAFWFGLWAQAVAIEGKSGVGALKRSMFLMKGNVGKMFVLDVLLITINIAISVFANLVPEPHVQVLVQSIVEAPLFGFAAAVNVVFYFSCRCKAENFDLMLLADSTAAESAAEKSAAAE